MTRSECLRILAALESGEPMIARTTSAEAIRWLLDRVPVEMTEEEFSRMWQRANSDPDYLELQPAPGADHG